MPKLHKLNPALFSLFVLTLIKIFSLPTFAENTITGKVVSIADGDTITVLVDEERIKVRLHGIDCPESSQDYGSVAKSFTGKAVHEKQVIVEITDIDRYGRTVGIVTYDGTHNLNQELVQKGLAWWYEQYAPDDIALKTLQEEARKAKIGIWSYSDPIPPWEFRRGGKPESKPNATVTTDSTYVPLSNRVSASTTSVAPGNTKVFITNTGLKYHLAGCSALSQSKIDSTISDAIGMGLKPCLSCTPPSIQPMVTQTPAITSLQVDPTISSADEVDTESATMVYVTKTGEKYHSGGCRYLSKSQIPLSLDRAKSGYSPCSVCSPPR